MKRHKIISIILITVILLCSLCSCEKSDKTEKSESTELPELKIGIDNLKEFVYKDENGHYTGIDVEIAEEACDRAGFKPVFVEIPWDEKDSYLQDGTVDCLWTAFSEDGREDDYQWTDPYMESELTVMVDEKSPDNSLGDLKSKGGVAVRAGTKAEEILLEESEAGNMQSGVYSCGSFEIAETAFVKGYAGAFACNKVVQQQIMSEYPGTYRIIDDPLMTVHLGVAFDKSDNSGKCQKINEALSSMKADGTIDNIYDKYVKPVSES